MNSAHGSIDPQTLMDFRHIRALVAIAETGSFTRAAEVLGLTQSAVSHSIKTFEQQLGMKLFHREPRSLKLTREGEALHVRALRVLAEMEGAHRDLTRLGRWDHASVRIGVANSLCALALPSVLREFRESFPAAEITIAQGNSPEVLADLRAGNIDFGISVAPPRLEDVRMETLFSDRLGLVMSPLNPLAAADPLPPAELAAHRLIVFGGKSATGGLVRGWLDSLPERHHPILEMSNIEAMREFALIDFGVALMPEWTVRREIQSGRLVMRPLPNKVAIERTWGIFSRPEFQPTLAHAVLRGVFSNVCRSL